MQCIPHRDPFLLVDCVTDLVAFDFIKAFRLIPKQDPIFQGHFPGNPVWPGVLVSEGLAQCGAVLGFLSVDYNPTTCMLTEISEARFRRPVLPGDRLDYFLKHMKCRGNFFWFEGEARVGDHIVSTVKLSALLR